MSYILEALRRAERERHLGQTPSVDALQQGSAGRPPFRLSLPPLRVMLAIASLVLLGIATIVLWRQPSQTASPAPAAAPPPAVLGTDTPAVAATPPPAADPLPAEEPGLPAIENGAVQSLDDIEAPFGSAEAPGPVIDEAPSADAPAVAPTEATPKPRSARREMPAAPEAPLLRDMAPAYRAQFPAVAMDVHVYDEDTGRRWILVAGKRYREGDTLAAGPRIIEILADGVIFEYGGQRVLLPLAR